MDPPATAPAVPTASDGDSNSGDGEEKEDAFEEEEEQTLLHDHVPGTSTRPGGNAGRNSLMVMANLSTTTTDDNGRRRNAHAAAGPATLHGPGPVAADDPRVAADVG